MKTKNHILAYILLSIYTFVFLHAIIPHSHHSAGQIESQIDTSEKATTSWLSLLDELVHQHEHQEDNHESFDEYKNETGISDFEFENEIVSFLSSSFSIKVANPILYEKAIGVDFLFFYTNRIPISESHRGPPAIV